MIITRIRIQNVGVFYGDQQLDLGPGLYLIHGSNGRGKTTLLNAVRWALYGDYRDRQGNEVPPGRVLNRQAAREGVTQFLVELQLDAGGQRFLIRRTQTVPGAAGGDRYVERDGVALTAGDANRAIEQLLAEKVSRFFLFDGEQLQQYESLLKETGNERIKQSIEQILGLPVLDNAIDDLRAVRDEFHHRLTREVRNSRQLEQAASQAEQAEQDLAAHDADLDQLDAELASQSAIVAENAAILELYENDIGTIRELQTTEAQLEQLRERRTEATARRADALRLSWRDLLAGAVAPELAKARHEVEAHDLAIADKALRAAAGRSLGTDACELCGADLDASTRAHVVAIAGPAVEVDHVAAGMWLTRLAQLAAITASGHARTAIAFDENLADIEADELTVSQQVSALREAVQQVPKEDVVRAERARSEAQEEIGRVRQSIENVRAQRAVTDGRLKRARDEIRKLSEQRSEHRELTRAISLAERLVSTYETAKARFRDQLREAVERTATEVFLQLTNEPGFAGLKINDSYGLEILDERGEVVTGRSAGQEQVVALSLIAALNRNAQRRGPVMMDTPFGRLDEHHGANILRFVPQLAEQVFLLVHGREITEDDLAPVAASVIERYELRRHDVDRTSLVVRSAL